ncbi:MAG: hypothetical protein WCE68_11340 [Anaerolineales bacterium]
MGEVLYRGKALALYNQVMLIDAEDIDAYPQWSTGIENAILGPKGVAVSALGDTQVEIIIYKGNTVVESTLYISGEIEIGKSGLIVGNEIAGTSERIPWPSGKAKIKVYANGPQNTATQIIFVLDTLTD